MSLSKREEWSSDGTRLVKLELARSPKFPGGLATSQSYGKVPGRKVRKIICHHSGANFLEGVQAPVRINDYHIALPEWDDGKLVGGGRGWPGIGYTFVVPARPEVVDGKFEIYRCWDDEWHTWHTGPAANSDGVGIVLAGYYESRHAPGFGRKEPDPTAMSCLVDLVDNYLIPRYGLSRKDVYGHFDFGKPACPGDFIETWIRNFRGERFEIRPPDPIPWEGDLSTAKARQWALSVLGYKTKVDGIWGPRSRAALEAFQSSSRLVVDGIWGRATDGEVRTVLGRLDPPPRPELP